MFLNAISSHVAVSQPILDALTELHSLVNVEKEKSKQHYETVQFEQGRSLSSWTTENGPVFGVHFQPFGP